jgi:hypothetical protein
VTERAIVASSVVTIARVTSTAAATNPARQSAVVSASRAYARVSCAEVSVMPTMLERRLPEKVSHWLALLGSPRSSSAEAPRIADFSSRHFSSWSFRLVTACSRDRWSAFATWSALFRPRFCSATKPASWSILFSALSCGVRRRTANWTRSALAARATRLSEPTRSALSEASRVVALFESSPVSSVIRPLRLMKRSSVELTTCWTAGADCRPASPLPS